MIKLTFIQNVLFLFGYRYIANKRSKEIHDLQYLNYNCHNELIKSKTMTKVIRLKPYIKLINPMQKSRCWEILRK